MGVKTQTTARFSSEDETKDQNASISHLVSRLRTAVRTVDFDQVEEALIAREAKLKREIKNLKSENAVLEEKHEFELLEKIKVEEERDVVNERYEKLLEEAKRGVECDDEDAILELRRKNRELESEKKKLEDLFDRTYKEWETRISRMENDTAKLMNERRRGSREIERSENGGMIVGSRSNNSCGASSPVIDLENVFELKGNGSLAASARRPPPSDHSPSKGNGKLQTSGVRKCSSILLIDRDDDRAPGGTLWKNATTEKPKDSDSLVLTGEEKNPKVLKRKQASSPSTSDNEHDDDNFEQEITPTSEMKQHLKSSLKSSVSRVNHCSEAVVVSANNDPTSRNPVILRQAEEEMRTGVKSQEFLRSLADSCTSSSSSSDSEDGRRLKFSYADAMQS